MNAKFSTPPPELGTRDEDDPVGLEVAAPLPPRSAAGLLKNAARLTQSTAAPAPEQERSG